MVVAPGGRWSRRASSASGSAGPFVMPEASRFVFPPGDAAHDDRGIASPGGRHDEDSRGSGRGRGLFEGGRGGRMTASGAARSTRRRSSSRMETDAPASSSATGSQRRQPDRSPGDAALARAGGVKVSAGVTTTSMPADETVSKRRRSGRQLESRIGGIRTAPAAVPRRVQRHRRTARPPASRASTAGPSGAPAESSAGQWRTRLRSGGRTSLSDAAAPPADLVGVGASVSATVNSKGSASPTRTSRASAEAVRLIGPTAPVNVSGRPTTGTAGLISAAAGRG